MNNLTKEIEKRIDFLNSEIDTFKCLMRAFPKKDNRYYYNFGKLQIAQDERDYLKNTLIKEGK